MFSKIRFTKIAACFLAFVVFVFSPLFLATAHAQVAGGSACDGSDTRSGGGGLADCASVTTLVAFPFDLALRAVQIAAHVRAAEPGAKVPRHSVGQSQRVEAQV